MLVGPKGIAMTNKEAAPDSDEESIYATALSEIQTDSVRPGLWAKAFADSEGDANKCKALYIRLRVQHEKDRLQQERHASHLVAVEAAQQKPRAFQNVIDSLSSCGYETKRTMSGWSIREPLGGRVKLKSDQALLDYAQGKTAIPAELSSKQGTGNQFVATEDKPFKPYPMDGMLASSFIDPTKLTQWLKFFLFVSIVIDAIALFSGVSQYQLLSDFKLGIYSSEALATAAAGSNDQRQQVIGWFQAGVAITTIILFAMWIYRANFNARSLGAQNMKFTPGWSVGYYFIPFINLWRPYQAMKEIWKASKNPTAWEGEERGAILPWWWFFFLIAGMFGNASLRTSMRAKEIHELITSTGITIASDLVSIPATIIALVLVRKIYEMQMSHVQRRI